jgi:hypothetical protein
MTQAAVSDQPEGQLLPRHIMWRRQYDGRRYALHLSQPELNKRIRDIILNMLHLQQDAKIGLGPINKQSAVWIEKWTHVLEEMQLRHGPYPSGFTREILHSEPFPDFVSELAEKAAHKLLSLGLQSGDVFIKFGKRAHMQSLLEGGILRIQPASFFFSANNGAIRDDELTIPVSLVLSRDDVVKVVVNPRDVPQDAADQRVDIQFHFGTDYWLYCVTNSAEPRLFVDFNADACVIIKDRQTFTRMLREATEREFVGTKMGDGPADYIDPLLPSSAKVFVPLAKHFGYTYQEEHRFFWIPPKPIAKQTHHDIKIGSLRGIADLIVL